MESYFAVVTPGLENFTAQELRSLFPDNAGRIETTPGGVEFTGNLATLYTANLHLRTASRILARLGNFFFATSFDQLRQRCSRLPWERCIFPGEALTLRVTCHKSRLSHSDAVARTVTLAIAERLQTPSIIVKPDESIDLTSQLVVIRLANDRCTVSVDSSGSLLHKRGYRQAVAKAPIRETLAAAMLMASGWNLESPLLDPFCGSGTIPIEAAMMALRIPPGLRRNFAFMHWPNFDQDLWEKTIGKVAEPPGQAAVILGSDRDEGAIQMSKANAERAGVGDRIEFKCQVVSAVSPPSGQGWVVTNPPYGHRIHSGKDLRDLYAGFGNLLHKKFSGWNLSMICSDPILLGQMQVRLDTSISLATGGIRVRLGRGVIP